ncbi:MAG: hypothetical protein K2X38_15190, partial [Gemmataceae bacterium]|nr:hypothetical protein [Gemmataceae bacterium]
MQIDVATNVAFCRERPPWRSAEPDDLAPNHPTIREILGFSVTPRIIAQPVVADGLLGPTS